MVERYMRYAEAWHKEPISITLIVITEWVLYTAVLHNAYQFLFLIYQKAYCNKRLDQLQKLLPITYQFKVFTFTDMNYWRGVAGYCQYDTISLRADVAYRLITNKAHDMDWIILYHEFTHGEGAQNKMILRALDCDDLRRFHPEPSYLYAFKMCLQAFHDICGLPETLIAELCFTLTSRKAYDVLGRELYKYYRYSCIDIALEEAMANINAGAMFYLQFKRKPRINGIWLKKIIQPIPRTFERLAKYPGGSFADLQILWGACQAREGKDLLLPFSE